jgi:phosphoglycerol transferase MdoB-like AlkP superfamily enzyme
LTGTGKRTIRKSLAGFLFVGFYAIAANIPFWVASRWLSILHDGWFSISYAVVGLLALIAPRALTALVFLLVMIADVGYGVSESYGIPAFDLWKNLGTLQEFSSSRILVIGTVAILALLVVGLSACLPATRIRRDYGLRVAACLVAFACLCLCTDFVTTTGRNGRITDPLVVAPIDSINPGYSTELRLSRIHLLRLVQSLLSSSRRDYQAKSAPVPSAAALAVSYAKLNSAKSEEELQNLVVILVESWGLSTDPTINQGLAEAYARQDLLARYEVHQGTVPFHGSTINAEARELCGSGMGFHILIAPRQELEPCLPYQMAGLGYRSVALHGMRGHVFNRSVWWDRIGFQQRWFRDRLQGDGLPDCVGAYVGTCDAAIAQWMEKRLEPRGTSPTFLYWVTLHSHLPVPVPSPFRKIFPCPAGLSLSPQSPLCSWYGLVANVNDSVARLAMGNLGRPTVFVIVGDHAPPFSDSVLRDQFSWSVVPYVVLVPRAEQQSVNRR